MIKIKIDSLWKHTDKDRLFFEPIRLMFSITKFAWYLWYFDFVLLNFELEIYWDREK